MINHPDLKLRAYLWSQKLAPESQRVCRSRQPTELYFDIQHDGSTMTKVADSYINLSTYLYIQFNKSYWTWVTNLTIFSLISSIWPSWIWIDKFTHFLFSHLHPHCLLRLYGHSLKSLRDYLQYSRLYDCDSNCDCYVLKPRQQPLTNSPWIFISHFINK